jgi:cytochrome-b5 reductase
VVGGAAYIYTTRGQGAAKDAGQAKKAAADAPKVFTGGDQGFVKLKLAESEEFNHNTRRLLFTFDDPNAVSGLTVACKNSIQISHDI